MRAVAVMLVVLGHAGLSDRIPGGSGVTIFFSIYGFIITFLLLREMKLRGEFDICAFYCRRALKILPPLVLVVLIPTIALGLSGPMDWRPFFGTVFFYYNWLRVHGVYPPLPGSVVVWSLSIEEQFYLFLAAIWLIATRFRKAIRWLMVVALCVTAASFSARLVSASSSQIGYQDRIYYGSDTRIEAIALGVITAIVFHHSFDSANRFSQKLIALCQRDKAIVVAAFFPCKSDSA